MEILVTGATGFIGCHLVRHLVGLGLSVTVLVREKPEYGELPGAHFAGRLSLARTLFADIRNSDQTTRAIRQAEPECVLHLAAVGASDPDLPIESALQHNVVGTLNLLRACFDRPERATRPVQLIAARTPGEVSALNVYAATKAAAWKFCQMYALTEGWPIHGAVIFQAYGAGQSEQALIPSALRAALADEALPITAGGQLRDWIHVSDVVAGLTAAIGANLSPGTSFDLGTGKLTSVKDVVQKVFELVGSRGHALVGALPDRPGEDGIQQADVKDTEDLLGWRSTVSLEEGLRRTWRQF